MSAFDGISNKAKIALAIAGLIMFAFFAVQTCIVFGLCPPSLFLAKFGWGCVITFMPPFLYVVLEFLQNKKVILRQIDNQVREMEDFQNFVEVASLVSKADKYGKITFVNKKFEDVSGWTLEEAQGKDHIIVNSNQQEKGYWGKMYETVHKGEIWNDIVTNKAKNGELYYVDTYIKANFNYKGERLGYTSIRQDVTSIVKATQEIAQKNTYLEHASKIIRHDMHSGINTYLPRGIKSLKRRLTKEQIEELKLQAPLQLIEDGLTHAQKVYSGVYEFTNLVKSDTQMTLAECNIRTILEDYLRLTAYKGSVLLDDSLSINILVNEALFCTAIDNLIRNGLRYNDSETKYVKIYLEGNYICVEDNGRGMTQAEFTELSKPYTRKEGQKESGTGLGLNICTAILTEHKFSVTAEKLTQQGTKLKIKIK